jgi:hypothetical protein
VTVRFTREGCNVETVHTIQPNGTYSTEITLSVDPASQLSLVIEEHATREVVARATTLPQRGSFRSTKFGFELVERR